MRKGQIVKVLHDEQKAYAAIITHNENLVTVRLFFRGELISKTLGVDECRKPHFAQDSSLASYVRQTVGVPLHKETARESQGPQLM